MKDRLKLEGRMKTRKGPVFVRWIEEADGCWLLHAHQEGRFEFHLEFLGAFLSHVDVCLADLDILDDVLDWVRAIRERGEEMGYGTLARSWAELNCEGDPILFIWDEMDAAFEPLIRAVVFVKMVPAFVPFHITADERYSGIWASAEPPDLWGDRYLFPLNGKKEVQQSLIWDIVGARLARREEWMRPVEAARWSSHEKLALCAQFDSVQCPQDVLDILRPSETKDTPRP